jgi:hypothetical protein
MQFSLSCRAKSKRPLNLSLGFAPGFLDFARNDAREIGPKLYPRIWRRAPETLDRSEVGPMRD